MPPDRSSRRPPLRPHLPPRQHLHPRKYLNLRRGRDPGLAIPTPPEAIGAIGRLFNQSISNIGAGVKGAGDTLGATTNAAGELAKGVTTGVTDAAGTVVKLPITNVVSGWQRCAVAPNGAPDCNVASVAMCRAKGFSSGSSIDITSSQKCPASVWAQARDPLPGECQDESFVSRAACQ